MASKLPSVFAFVLALALIHSPAPCFSVPRILWLVPQNPIVLTDHHGALLSGNITVNILWYGRFSDHQHSVVSGFLSSLSPSKLAGSPPTASSWWSIVGRYRGGPRTITLGKQTLDWGYSLGKSLKNEHLKALALKAGHSAKASGDTVNFVLTSSDVSVEGFCMSRCGTHGSMSSGGRSGKVAYAWVGNSIRQCPGQCAWPFHRPIYGPQNPPLVPPSGDAGADGMVINIATVLAGAVMNPFDGGYYQGDADASVEAVTACTGIFGKGAFPGYPGTVLKDKVTEASYNAMGVNGRKFLLPAMWDPRTRSCKTLV